MTLIAGIFSRKDRPIPASACESLRQSISRHSDDEVSVFKDDRSYLVKVDIEAFGEPGVFVDSNGAVAMLAGEPLLSVRPDRLGQSRQRDLELIHDGLMQDDSEILRKAEGTFASIHYDPRAAALTLVTDKLGLRPLYYFVDGDIVSFASALRILEGLPQVPKTMNLRAVTEIAAFGMPLNDRTPYADIFLLKPAEILRITESKVLQTRYWRWDEIETAGDPEPVRLQAVYDHFQQAVARRNRNNKTTVAYLSGGLDSRCIVGALAGQHVRVHTFNFARPSTQDSLFGNEFARQMQTIHESVPKEPGDMAPDYSSMMAKSWRASPHRGQWPAERPGLVWSGEGGSQALGHIHLNETIVGRMRAGDVCSAVEEFLHIENIQIAARLFKPQVFTMLADLLKKGIREELNELHSQDAGRDFYLFLMLNEQRRKLTQHFENIDLHRLEFQLPFFDGGFLAAVIATPIDLCLRHSFYAKWLTNFPPAVTSVPWQTYPRHEPCPVPSPQGVSYQWDEEYQVRERAAQRQRLTQQASELLRVADFPDKILSRRNLRLAAWIHSTGWRDYGYMIQAASAFYSYWKASAGTYALPQQHQH